MRKREIRPSSDPEVSRRMATAGLLVVLTVAIWLTAVWLHHHRGQRLDRRAETAVAELADRTVALLAERHAALIRLQESWPRTPAADPKHLQAVVRLLPEQSPGLVELYRLDSEGAVRWSTRDTAQPVQRIIDRSRAAPTFHLARRTGEAKSTPALPLDDGSWGFVTFLPVVGSAGLEGFVGAVFSFRQMLESVLAEDLRGALELRLLHDGVEVWRHPEAPPSDAADEEPAAFVSQVSSELEEWGPFRAAFLIEDYRYRIECRRRPEAVGRLLDPWPWLLAAHLGVFLLVAWVDRLGRRRSERRAQAHLMDGVFSNLPVTAFSIGPDGAVERSFGKAAVGLGLSSGGGETLDAFPVLVHPLQRALSGESVHLEADLEVEGGDRRTFELFLLHDELRGSGALGFAIDVSTRKWMEKALQSSEERYRRFFREAPFAYFAVDLDGRIELANTLAAELTGYPGEDLLGLECSRLFADRDSAPLVTPEPEEKIRNREVEILRADGSTFWGSLSVQPLHDDQGYVGSGLIVLDITRRKSLQEQVRQSQKMEAVGRLAGGIAHDFNNLLTAIMGYARMGLENVEETPRIRRNLQEIEKACRRATSLVSQLLAFSRRQIVEPKIFDLNELLRDMDPMLRRLTREEVELASHLSRDLGRIRMDPGQMEQVIVNLVVNAQEAISGSGWVTLETDNYSCTGKGFEDGEPSAEPRERVRLRVSDTGSGMSPEVREHIFEPFFTTKEDLSGTGLGLATVYGIVVEQSSGQIEVDSEVGKGTTISVLLPRVYGDIDREEEPLPPARPTDGYAHILLVEDEDMVRELAAEMLSSLGYGVTQARNGLDALDVIGGREHEIDLLLTDVVMPKMGGEKLYLELRQRHPDIRVLYSSGYTESAVIHHGVKEGEVPFVHKPYTFDALAHAVQSVLKR